MRITARPRVGGRRAAAVSAVTARPPAGWGGVAPYGRAGRRMSSWWLVTSRSTSRLYRVLCVLRPLLAQVPAAAAPAGLRFGPVVAFWSRLLGYLSRLRSCGSVGSVPGSGVPHTEPPTVPRHAAPWRLAARSPHPHRVEGN